MTGHSVHARFMRGSAGSCSYDELYSYNLCNLCKWAIFSFSFSVELLIEDILQQEREGQAPRGIKRFSATDNFSFFLFFRVGAGRSREGAHFKRHHPTTMLTKLLLGESGLVH